LWALTDGKFFPFFPYGTIQDRWSAMREAFLAPSCLPSVGFLTRAVVRKRRMAKRARIFTSGFPRKLYNSILWFNKGRALRGAADTKRKAATRKVAAPFSEKNLDVLGAAPP
jgi:hypothetical protein